ncbi:MAG: hypothetical protein AAB420_03490 [Patescibacteria group bacterium]
MTTYTRIVMEFIEKLKLTGMFVYAAHLAYFLDHDLFRIVDGEGKLLKEQHHGDTREKAFTMFCTVLAKSDVPVPPLEPTLWQRNLPRIYDEKQRERERTLAAELRSELLDALDGRDEKEAQEILTIANTFVLLADRGAFDRIERPQIIAVLNDKLTGLGLDPIRPKYAELELKKPISSKELARELSVLIVDDDLREMLRSALALVGIPNINFQFFHQYTEHAYPGLEGEAKDAELARVADAIMAMSPDIILMDQGLRGINGSDLVLVIKARGCKAVFVANTGGGGSELAKAGCLDNFGKGENRMNFADALSYFN